MLSAFESSFEAEHPTFDLQWLDMGSQDAYDRVRTERGRPQADVWWGGPSLNFIRAERESLLASYVPPWDSAVPPGMKSPRGFWYGTFVTPEVIMYNNRLLRQEEVPADWDGLLDRRWRGRIIIRSPIASGTMRIIFSALLLRARNRTGSDDEGFAWLKRLDANTKTYAADPTQLYLKIAREEGVLTVWNLPDVITQVERNGYPFAYRFPSSGTPLITDGIAIVRGAQHPEGARRFYDHVTTIESLLDQARRFGRIPARTDVPRDQLPGWIARLAFTPMSIDWDTLEVHEREWMRHWDAEVKGRGE
jgi:iron(III) transport system substrate-binding protein